MIMPYLSDDRVVCGRNSVEDAVDSLERALGLGCDTVVLLVIELHSTTLVPDKRIIFELANEASSLIP